MKLTPRAVTALWAAAFVCLVAMAGLFVWDQHQAAARQLAAVEPRFARLVGLSNDRAKLEGAVSQARATLARHAYPAAAETTQAGNDAQQRARDVFARAGMEVLSSQVLAAKTSGNFDRIPLTLRVEGELPALQAAMAALPTLAPSLHVEGFSVQGAVGNRPEDAVKLVVQLDMFVLRVRG